MKWTLLLLVSLCCGLAAAKCKYRKNGDWTACSAEGLRSRTDVLKPEKSDASCAASRNITKVCREDCRYERRRRAEWGACDLSSSTIAATRKLVSGEGCPAQVTETFDCRVQRRFSKPAGRARKNKKKAMKKMQRRQKNQQRREQKQQRRQQRRQQRQQRRQNRKNQNQN